LKNQKINIFNRQRKLPIDTRNVRAFLQELTAHLEIDKGYSVVFISDRAMTRYNRQFAGKNSTTDVLSFPVEQTDLEADEYMGDVLISVEKAKNQTEYGSVEEEIKVLCLHGILHLLGYDHENDNGEMLAVEKQIREELGLQK
jgi:probable rRNA maturation factor